VTDALDMVWEFLDSPALLVTHAEVLRWPPAAFADLTRLGFLRPATGTDYAACPSCPDRHVEEVLCRVGSDGVTRYYIPCPETLRVEIAADDLRRWMIDVDAVAHALAAAVSPGGRCTQRIPLRLWRLGALPHAGVQREVLLLRGIGWLDAGDLLHQLGGNGRAIVFIAGMPPPHVAWPDLPATLVPLPQTCSLDGSAITLALP